tara:strand:+ start:326 stop:649 length:324 start_codon:yes stop_codon:yes gene_type:complete
MALENKTDFTNFELGLQFVRGLFPVTYKCGEKDSLDVGFKAEEIQERETIEGYELAFKNNLFTSLSEDGKQLNIEYINFIPLLVNAIKEVSEENEELRTRLIILENK